MRVNGGDRDTLDESSLTDRQKMKKHLETLLEGKEL
jgi:hypothetical protein